MFDETEIAGGLGPSEIVKLMPGAPGRSAAARIIDDDVRFAWAAEQLEA